LRRDHERFSERNTVVLVAGPEEAAEFEDYFRRHDLPFTGLPDPGHEVLRLYGQEARLFQLGRMPVQVLVDKQGVVRYAHYGLSILDIPANEEILDLIDAMEDTIVRGKADYDG
jgi:peroxiredoxin